MKVDINALSLAESNNNPNKVGTVGEVGIHQIRPKGGVLDDWNRVFKKRQYEAKDLKDPAISSLIAGWWINEWLPSRYMTAYDIEDTERNRIICWNRGSSNAAKWIRNGAKEEELPKATTELIKRYMEAKKI